MILTKDDTKLPEWVSDVIMTECKYCGSPIASNHDIGPLTERWCTNPLCPGHMSYKMNYVAKYYDIKGFGPKVALNWIEENHPTNHLEILKCWFEDRKPKESLSRITDLCCIKEFGLTTGQSFLDSYGSFEDFFNAEKSKEYPILLKNKKILIESQEFFEVKKAMLGFTVPVMATGSIHGFANRDAFFDSINEVYGDICHIVQVGARKSNVLCLIKEEDAVDHRKSRIAQEAGIPIVTSTEFASLIREYVIQKVGYDPLETK